MRSEDVRNGPVLSIMDDDAREELELMFGDIHEKTFFVIAPDGTHLPASALEFVKWKMDNESLWSVGYDRVKGIGISTVFLGYAWDGYLYETLTGKGDAAKYKTREDALAGHRRYVAKYSK